MDTAQQALFRAMLNNDWATKSDGDVDSSTGFFGYMTNPQAEVASILDAFADIVVAYGRPADSEIVGSWVVRINSHGIIFIDQEADDNAAHSAYRELSDRYTDFLDQAEEEF